MNSLQEQRELEMLEKIKINVERIKANQRKFEPDIIAAKSHNEAVRYNGKYLYEEVVENAENNQTRNESTEDEESVVLRNQPQPKEMRKDEADIIEACQSTVSIQSIAQDDEENIPNNYLIPMLRDFIISLTLYLYKFSRNYRFVHEFLSQDKKLLKLKACHGASSEESGEERIYFFSHQHSVVSELIQSIWFALIANTDVICYLLIFLNIIFTMSIAMLPLSMCVCFWAALTIPRPSKRFWLTVIVFIEITVFLQYILHSISPIHSIKFNASEATFNLILLFFVMFHRSVMKNMGIWTKKKTHIVTVHAFELLKTSSPLAPIIQIPADVYTFMFLCDLVNFFVLMFGFLSFSQSSSVVVVQNYLIQDQIPFGFLLTLFVNFVSMIIDRALYLRRNMKGKIIFYVISVIALHIWQLYFMAMHHLKPSHAVKWPPLLFYFIKCLYLILSAYQIRCGYPKRVSGNFASNGYSLMHWRVFQFYNIIPFLPEARTLLDWTCIKTSLTIYEWFKMEDIYSEVFSIKCHRLYEKTLPRGRGVIRGTNSDNVRAFFSLGIVFVLIWGPWAFFTFDHTVGKSNVPYEVSVSLYVGSTEPLYRMRAQTKDIHRFTEYDFDKLKKVYTKNTAVQSFLSHYDEEDIAAISLDVNSSSLWIISPPSLHKLKRDLIENVTLKLRYSVSVSRSTHEQPSDIVEANQLFYLQESDSARQELLNIFNDGYLDQRVHLTSLFPKFLKVTNSKGMQPIPQFSSSDNGNRNITLHLNENNGMKWWDVVESCKDSTYQWILSKLPYAECGENSVLYTFNDKLYPSSLSPYIGGGIIGLYSTYILLTSQFFREFLTCRISHISREDLPYVDRILQLCSDIYLVREQGEFELEEDLYAKLIFLYRSPETLIRWTRQPLVETTTDYPGDIDESDAEKALRTSLKYRII